MKKNIQNRVVKNNAWKDRYEKEENTKMLLITIVLLFVIALLVIFFQVNVWEDALLMDRVITMAVTITTNLVFFSLLSLYLYISNKWKGKLCRFKKFFFGMMSFLVALISFPIFIIDKFLYKIAILLKVGEIYKNLSYVLVKSALLLICYAICVGYKTIYSLNFIEYTVTVLIIFLLYFLIIKLIEPIFIFRINNERYLYRTESKAIQTYVANLMIMFCSVASMFNTGEESTVDQWVYIIMPVIIFFSINQIILVAFNRKVEKNRFLNQIYDELIIVKDIAIPSIEDTSCMKVRIRLSVEWYTIETQINFHIGNIQFFWGKDKKTKLLNTMLIDLKELLLIEYCLYKDNEIEKKEINKLNENIEKNINNITFYLLNY